MEATFAENQHRETDGLRPPNEGPPPPHARGLAPGNGHWGWGTHLTGLRLLVILNIADRTLNNKKPTPTAIVMIMAGSIRFVITRN